MILERTFLLVLPLLLLIACTPKATVQTGEQIAEQLDLPPYHGTPALIAVGPCENRTGGAGTFTVDGTRITLDNEIGRGMGDMLVSALANTGRFAVVEASPEVVEALERQRAARGQPEGGPGQAGADLLITCGVTEFEPEASGIGGGAANVFGRTLAGAIGGTATSRVGIDIRLVDVSRGFILSAFTVHGEARDVRMGALMARRLGPVGALGGLSNTPVEAAVRIALLEAVKEIALRTPPEYFRPLSGIPRPDGGDMIEPMPVDDVQEGEPDTEPEIVFVTAGSLNLRSESSTTAEVVASLNRGARLTVLERRNGWIHVRTEAGKEGWVSAAHVSGDPGMW
jgi:curli biogenesis system outer membrane secretion channel CsgG